MILGDEVESNRPSVTELFVNRGDLIDVFERALSNIAIGEPRQVLTFHGAGGQGKTHLRKYLSKMLPEKPTESESNLRWGIVDLHEYKERGSEDILIWIRNELKTKSKVHFPAFDLVFALFWKERHGSQTLPFLDNPWWEEISGAAGEVITDKMTEFLPHVPLVSSIVGRLGRVLLDHVHEELLLRRSDEALKEVHSKGKWLPANEIRSMLPIILARDISHWCTKHPGDRFVVMVDEYETALDAGGAGSRFKLSEFDDTVRNLITHCTATLFVFFSREKLRWGAIDQIWNAALDGRQHALGGLSKNHAEELLTIAGVDSTVIRAAMINGASARDPISDVVTCYPIMLEMQIELFRSLSADGSSVVADHFRIDGENFETKRNMLLSRLVRSYPWPLEATLRQLSVTRRFDKNVFKFVIKEFLTGLPADAWSSVQALSLVQQSTVEGLHMFHQVIREGLLATLDPEVVHVCRATITMRTRVNLDENPVWGEAVRA